ncbi:MAG: AAA family ATPase [Pseudomonadota bacterium]
MKILSLRVEQFKKFDQPVLVGNFGGGLNLIAGPNETGKSTLLLALRAALFERHGAKTQTVKDFSPHHVTGARPTITLEFEVDGERYRLEKSFLKRPHARLENSHGQRFEGSDAERELKRLLRLDLAEKTTTGKDSPAHFGVLLTPQARSFQQPNLADGTRHSLEAAIAADIAELGNQSEVDGLLAEIDMTLFGFVSKRGEPKNRYKDVATRLTEIEHETEHASLERDALREQLDQLEQAIAARQTLQAADDQEKLAERLASLEAARAQAAERQVLENHRLAASQRLQAVEAKRAARQSMIEERARIAAEVQTVETAAEEAKARLATIEQALSECEERLADLRERQRSAEERRRDLEALGRRLEDLCRIEATLDALATDVRLDLTTDGLDRVRLDGEAATATSDLRQVVEGLSIEIDGIGRIGIEPKIEPMREALAAKVETEGEIQRLRRALDLEDAEQEMIEAAWQAVADDIEALNIARTERETALADGRQQAAEAKAASAASADRQIRLSERLAELDIADGEEETDDVAFGAEISEARAALDVAEAALKAAPLAQGIGAVLDAEIDQLRSRIEERRRSLEDAGKKVLALEAAIAVRAGLGLDEKIDQLDRRRHLLTRERDAFALDHRAMTLLQSTLKSAADEAKASFNAPLSARLAPYIQDLFPGAVPLVTPAFSIRAIDRNGVEEPFLQLSDGTREQIAILARLAYADMLREQGLPALIVLDDALAFSDDARHQRMFNILKKAAERLQVIILTCREDRFTDLDATRLAIEPSPEPTSSAA